MTTKQFLDAYERGLVQVTPEVFYYTQDVIENSNRLRHGVFTEPFFKDKTKKIFYNISHGFSNIIYRHTDLDTKDINMRALNGRGMHIIGLFKMGVRSWMRNSGFATTENEIRKEMIDMGHVVTKFVGYETKTVDLMNLVVPPHAEGIHTSGCVEKTYLTWEEMLMHKDEWKKSWKKIEALHEAMDAEGDIYFTVYEHWKVDEFEDESGKKTIDKGCVKSLDMTTMKPDNHEDVREWEPVLELERFISPWERNICSKRKQKLFGKKKERIYPYKERRFIKLPRRWLGFGVFELLSGFQEDYNEKLNLKRKFDRLALRGILVHTKSADENKLRTLTQEFLTNVETGAAISLENDEQLNRLNLGSTTPDVIAMIDKLFEIMRIVIGITQETTGEKTPSTTTATVGIINQKVAQTTYDVVIEEQSLLLTELFQDFVLPEVIEELDAEEVYELTGSYSEFSRIDRFLAEQMVWREYEKAAIKPTEQQVEAEIERLTQEMNAQGEHRYAGLKKYLLDGVNYLIEFYVNNESFDKQTQITNILQMLNNPLYTGSRLALEAELRDLMGLYGSRYEKTESEKLQEMAEMRLKTMMETPPDPMMPNDPGAIPADQQFEDSARVTAKQ